MTLPRTALLLALAACHSGTAPSTAPRPSPVVDATKATGRAPTLPPQAFTFADPSKSSRTATVTARLVSLRDEPPLCGTVHWGALVEYELVSVDAGSLTGMHFLAAVGCVQLSRKSYDTNAGTLDAFRVGATHRLSLSTDSADSRGMTSPVSGTPFFYVISADPA